MGDNIRHEREAVIGSLAAINSKISSLQSDMEAGYSTIAGGISKSSCEHIDALLENIETERSVASAVVSFLSKMTSMMDQASQSLETVENNYSVQKVE